MLKKRFKLNTSQFKEVFNFGQTLRTPLFLLKKKENNLIYSRFAVVVSKKLSKKAFERNYLKRRFISAVSERVDLIPKADYIFILNSSAKDVKYKDLLISLDTI